MDVSGDKTIRHHNPDDKYLKKHHHKKCVAIFMFSVGTKLFMTVGICLDLLVI
jgi:hypothetical protein